MLHVPPYAASLRWYAGWFGSRLSGLSDSEAIAEANRLCGVAGKDFSRTFVGSPSEGALLLGVAVEGGASRLKRPGGERRAKISLHGNWPHVHIGAMEAVYGRMPYFAHLMPGFRSIIDKPGATLAGLNRRMHEWISGYIFIPDKGLEQSEAVIERGKELAESADADLSVLDALMRFGPETNLVLMCLYTEASAVHVDGSAD